MRAEELPAERAVGVRGAHGPRAVYERTEHAPELSVHVQQSGTQPELDGQLDGRAAAGGVRIGPVGGVGLLERQVGAADVARRRADAVAPGFAVEAVEDAAALDHDAQQGSCCAARAGVTCTG